MRLWTFCHSWTLTVVNSDPDMRSPGRGQFGSPRKVCSWFFAFLVQSEVRGFWLILFSCLTCLRVVVDGTIRLWSWMMIRGEKRRWKLRTRYVLRSYYSHFLILFYWSLCDARCVGIPFWCRNATWNRTLETYPSIERTETCTFILSIPVFITHPTNH